MSHDNELSDLSSVVYASHMPKPPVEPDRDVSASAPPANVFPPAGPAAPSGTRGTVLVPQGPAWWSSLISSGDSTAAPSHPVPAE